MIPLEIDVQTIVADLNSWGWRDQKIEIICGFSGGYVAKLRSGTRENRPYQLVARLYNFWEEQSCRTSSAQSTQIAPQCLPTGKLWTTARSD